MINSGGHKLFLLKQTRRLVHMLERMRSGSCTVIQISHFRSAKEAVVKHSLYRFTNCSGTTLIFLSNIQAVPEVRGRSKEGGADLWPLKNGLWHTLLFYSPRQQPLWRPHDSPGHVMLVQMWGGKNIGRKEVFSERLEEEQGLGSREGGGGDTENKQMHQPTKRRRRGVVTKIALFLFWLLH